MLFEGSALRFRFSEPAWMSARPSPFRAAEQGAKMAALLRCTRSKRRFNQMRRVATPGSRMVNDPSGFGRSSQRDTRTFWR
jgi:hypothetical protein